MFHNKFISCLYTFRANVLIMKRSKLHYTASVIVAAIGGRLVHGLTENSLNPYMFRAHVFIIRSKLDYTASGIIILPYRWLSRAQVDRGLSQTLHVSSTCVHHQVKIRLHSLWYHHITL